ncbi:MAG: diacylglycerol kinase family protein [Anaerolineae bacterium]
MIDLQASAQTKPPVFIVADTIKVILNPLSGAAKQAKVEQALRRAALNYHVEVTQYRGHAIELARQAALEGWPLIVAAGGDGTVSEVVNGLMQAAGDGVAGTLGILPLGTANDLAAALNLPQNLAAACQRLQAGQTRLIDVGQVNGRYFVNNSAVGLEPLVTMAYEKIGWIKGTPRYLVAALQCIWRATPWHMQVAWNQSQYDGPITLVSVGNTRRTGGMFYLTPQAQPNDGYLDFVYAGQLSRTQLFRLLPQTLKGSHIATPHVVYRRTAALSITAATPTPIQADGEIIDLAATTIHYRILPGKLRLLV